MLGDFSGGGNITEMTQDRTLTPEGAWDGPRSSAFPWPINDGGHDPFSNEGLSLTVLSLILCL